ncbi:MAG: O-antigen ligase family protein [Thermogutta sp.]
MSGKRRRQIRENTQNAPMTGSKSGGNDPSLAFDSHSTLRRLRIFFLGLLMMVLAARPLFPSEGADLGDGVAVVMLLLGATTIGLTFFLGKSRLAIRFGWTDIIVLGVVMLAAAASLRGKMVGTSRPAMNMLWEWLGYGLIWGLIRQLRLNARERRILLAGMAAVAVGIASYGLYQYLIEFPTLRREYQTHRSEWLHSLGWDDLQTNPTWLTQLENRLYSREPLATFALANSLAGFLLPWTVLILSVSLVLGIPSERPPDAADRKRTASSIPGDKPRFFQSLMHLTRSPHSHQIVWTVVLVLALGLLGICLILTKSRSAYVSMFVVVAILLGASLSHWKKQWRIATCIITGLVISMIGVAIFLRGLDWAVLSEAGKSLSYRWEYWLATTRMIWDHPLLGCGPGNFRYAYLRYKLPQASEEVSDPHNFVLELAATAGLPAALALCFGLLRTGIRLLQLASRWRLIGEATPFDPGGDKGGKKPIGRLTFWSREFRSPEVLALGCGWLLAWPAGWWFGLLSSAPQTATFVLVAAPVAGLTLRGLWPWIKRGQWSPLVALLGLIALGIHWLASGGLSFPGVAYSFWLIWALGEDLLDEASPVWEGVTKIPMVDSLSAKAPFLSSKRSKEVSLPGGWAYAASAAFAMTTFLCYYTAYAPVLDARRLMAEAAQIKGISSKQARELLHKAAKADPWAYEPWLRLLELRVEAMRAGNDGRKSSANLKKMEIEATGLPDRNSLRQELEDYAEHLLTRARNHHAVRWNLAIAYQEYARLTGEKNALQQAITYAHEAIALYPYQATYYVGYAEMLLQAGNQHEAREAARMALWLHDVTPHQDRKLPDETVAHLRAIVETDTSRHGGH